MKPLLLAAARGLAWVIVTTTILLSVIAILL